MAVLGSMRALRRAMRRSGISMREASTAMRVPRRPFLSAHRLRRQARRNIASVGKTFEQLHKQERAFYPRTIALLFLPYNPGPEPAGAELATEFRYTVAKTRALQRYCRRGLGLAALSLGTISLVFLVPWPWGIFAWAGAAYGVGRLELRNKSWEKEQLAYIESTYRLGGFGAIEAPWYDSPDSQQFGGLKRGNAGVIIGKSGPGKSMMLDDPYAASTVSAAKMREWWAGTWPGRKR